MVSFEAKTGLDTTQVLFEHSASVASVKDCAKVPFAFPLGRVSRTLFLQTCYREGCTIAEFIPAPGGPYANLQRLGACYLGFKVPNPSLRTLFLPRKRSVQAPDSCNSTAQRHFVFSAATVVDITCVRCGSQTPLASILERRMALTQCG